MGRMLQVRNLPDEMHAELARRAKLAGISQSDFVKKLIERELRHMDKAEWVRMVKETRPHLNDIGMTGVDLVQDGRRELDKKWDRLWGDRYGHSESEATDA